MNTSDIEFTIGLNTSPAEQQLDKLYDKMRLPGVDNRADPLLQQVSREYQQGFKMVGGVYDTGSNHFAVPSVKVFETALVVTSKSIQKFNSVVSNVINLSNSIIDAYAKKISQPLIEYKPNNFSPYKNTPHISPIYQQFLNETERGFTFGDYEGNNYDVPSTIINSGGLVRTGRNVSKWSPSEFYTRDQVDSINYNLSHNDIFNSLIYKRKANKPYNSAYDLFNQIHSTQGASGMYDIWQGLFGRKGILALPSSQYIWTGASGDDTPEEQGKDLVEQEKKDNDELKTKLRLWVKIGSTIYAIRKVLQGLSKVWRFGAETVSGVNSNLNEEHGYFSVDPEGALRANTDKTRSMWYAGVRNMGNNAPVSKAGLDEMASIFTEMWTSAMSGRNVDARTTIDAQRIKEFFGADYTIDGLLTGIREGKTATDVQRDLVQKVEQQIYKLAEVDEVQRGQLIDSLKHLFGSELIDAIVANSNKNLKIAVEDRKTVIERLESAGGSAIPSGDLTQATTQAVTAISDFKSATQDLKNTLVQELSPAFSKVTEALTILVNWINKKINKVDGTKDATGGVAFKTSVASLANDYSAYGYYKQKENDKKDAFTNKKERIAKDMKSKSIYDIFEAMYLAQIEADDASDIENLGIKATMQSVGARLARGQLDKNSINPIENALANYSYTDPKGRKFTGIEAFKSELASEGNLSWNNDLVYQLFNNPNGMSTYDQIRAYEFFLKNNPVAKEAFSKAFDKGGVLDYNTPMNVGKYLMNPAFYESGEAFLNYMNEMRRQSTEVLDNTFDINTAWNDRNKNGKIDFGEVDVTLVVRDQAGTVISKHNLQGEVQ